jgi:hypothetical protein
MYDDVGSGSTAIFCRSTQFSKAAILLSCQQGQHLSPVINLDFPPCSIPEYKEKLKLYRKHETSAIFLPVPARQVKILFIRIKMLFQTFVRLIPDVRSCLLSLSLSGDG